MAGFLLATFRYDRNWHFVGGFEGALLQCVSSLVSRIWVFGIPDLYKTVTYVRNVIP